MCLKAFFFFSAEAFSLAVWLYVSHFTSLHPPPFYMNCCDKTTCCEKKLQLHKAFSLTGAASDLTYSTQSGDDVRGLRERSCLFRVKTTTLSYIMAVQYAQTC